MERKKTKAAINSEPGGTEAGDWGGGKEGEALPPQSPRLPRLFSSFPPSESLEQAKQTVSRNRSSTYSAQCASSIGRAENATITFKMIV